MSKDVKNKKDRKITALDVVIVLLTVGLLATFAYRIYDGVAAPDFVEDSKYSVEFVCEGEYNSIAKYLENGEAVYLASTGELLGNLYVKKAGSPVIAVTGGSSQPEDGADGSDETADTVAEELYEKVTLSGHLKLNADATAVSTAGYYTIGSFNLTSGSVIDVFTEDTVFTLKIVSITPIQ